MATHPLVLLVEPNPLRREILHGELKNQGCIVVDAVSGEDALAFAELYPGAIDVALTDLPSPAQATRAFVTALRALPTGTRAKVLRLSTGETPASPLTVEPDDRRLPLPLDRAALTRALRRAHPLTEPPPTRDTRLHG